MDRKYDIAIIGGGASGMMAALRIKTKRPEVDVVLIEKKETLGKKLSVTGGGKCNISNRQCMHFADVADFLSELGVEIREGKDDGFYPYCEDAKELARYMGSRVRELGVHVMLSAPVTSVEVREAADGNAEDGKTADGKTADGKTAGRFELAIENSTDRIFADKVLIATGGKSYGHLGTSGDGYVMARKLGHTVTRPVPGLTAIEIADDISSLKGLRVKAEVSLLCGNKLVCKEKGEVQFREDSISGICVMNLSSHVKAGEERPFSDYVVSLNFAEEMSLPDLAKVVEKRAHIEGLHASEFLSTLVKGKLAQIIFKRAEIEPDKAAAEMTDRELLAIIHYMREFRLTVSGLKGWKEAQVTIGGVELSQINGSTQESKLVKGLFFSGEVLDYAGPCGGYNLHHAWLSGMKAADGMIFYGVFR